VLPSISVSAKQLHHHGADGKESQDRREGTEPVEILVQLIYVVGHLKTEVHAQEQNDRSNHGQKN
jgi:hypothetical protein